ncbi:MAG: NAD-dependent epimerase/dehydratase family protein [Deltaproteobacteria bacterium]|nr:NAD-dependent epimerase/dehydratase family protein [Deltaproteobacteria bacterium]
MNWASLQVLVTGGGGFLGSHLCEALLKKGAKKLTLFGHLGERAKENLGALWKEVETIPGDIVEERQKLGSIAKRSDLIFHLAGMDTPSECQEHFDRALHTNVLATAHLLSNAERCSRLLFFSSALVYSHNTSAPLCETDPLLAESAYATTKQMAELLCQNAYHEKKLPVTIVRNFNIYGPRQDTAFVIPSIITQALSKRAVELWNPEPIRDFTYVVDAIDAMIRIAEAPSLSGEVVNLGTGEGQRIGDIAKTLSNFLGVPVCFMNLDRGETTQLICDRTKLTRATGWVPAIPLLSGLQQTIEYYKRQNT